MAYGGIESDYRPARWGSFREPYKFSGKEEDIEVGLSYFGARYYSTALGRWMSPDAVTIHDLKGDANPYAYVHGSPLMGVDPDGNFAQMFWGAVIGAVVSTVTQFAVNGSVDWGQVGQAAVVGAITGGVGSVLGVATSLLANAAIGAATGAAGYLAQSGVSYVASGGKSSGFSWTGLAVSTGVGAVSGGVSSQLPAAIQGNAAAKIASGSVMSMGGYAAATAASGERITTKGLSTSAASGGVSAMASLGAGKLQAQESEGPDGAVGRSAGAETGGGAGNLTADSAKVWVKNGEQHVSLGGVNWEWETLPSVHYEDGYSANMPAAQEYSGMFPARTSIIGGRPDPVTLGQHEGRHVANDMQIADPAFRKAAWDSENLDPSDVVVRSQAGRGYLLSRSDAIAEAKSVLTGALRDIIQEQNYYFDVFSYGNTHPELLQNRPLPDPGRTYNVYPF